MGDFFERVVAEPLRDVFERLLDFLPNLLTSVVVLAAGFLAAWALKFVTVRLLRMIKMDRMAERSGVAQALQRGGIREPVTGLVGRLIYWITAIVAAVLALDALRIPAVKEFLGRFFLYLPNVFAAVAVIVLGYMIGNFIGRTALIASVNAGIKVSGLIGKFVKLTIFLLTASMALELLGIGKETILIAFAAIFGGVVFAFALAFGLGGKDIAKTYIENRLKGGEKKDDIEHI